MSDDELKNSRIRVTKAFLEDYNPEKHVIEVIIREK